MSYSNNHQQQYNSKGKRMFGGKSGGILVPALVLGMGFTLGAGLMKAGIKYANKFSGGKFPSEITGSFRANRNWYLYDYQMPT
jgi:hypothetical protein